MKVYYTDNAMKHLDAKLAFVHGRGAQKTTQAIALEIVDGNKFDRLNGRDRYGKTLIALRSKRTGKYKGATGPPLAPFGAASRSVSAFRAKARQRGGFWQISAGWVDVLSKAGVPFLPFHAMGRGRLPRRDIFGISPRTWARIKPIVDAFKAKAIKVKT